LFLLGRLALRLYKRSQLWRSGIAELDQLNGVDFERYLVLLFGKLGYTVQHTPAQGDYGADLILQKAGVQTAVQAKRHQRAVGIKAVQEVVAAKEYYRCEQAMVVTNNYYSQAAQALAKANQVTLWDRDTLVKQLLALKQQSPEAAVAPTPPEETPAPQSVPAICCAICGKTVSVQVQNYCLSHASVFGGKIYCYEHQKVVRHKTSQQVTKAD
jgi:restriction system protein